MTDKKYIYIDPYGRHWTKENLDEAIKLLHNLRNSMKDVIDYY